MEARANEVTDDGGSSSRGQAQLTEAQAYDLMEARANKA